MRTVKYVSWEEDDGWIGYLQDYPDYWTQGDTLVDLKEHLRDLHLDISTGMFQALNFERRDFHVES